MTRIEAMLIDGKETVKFIRAGGDVFVGPTNARHD